MVVERVTVSLEGALAAAIREAAEADEANVSAWLAEAARMRLAARGLGRAVEAWEAEHGPITEGELEAARRRLGW